VNKVLLFCFFLGSHVLAQKNLHYDSSINSSHLLHLQSGAYPLASIDTFAKKVLDSGRKILTWKVQLHNPIDRFTVNQNEFRNIAAVRKYLSSSLKAVYQNGYYDAVLNLDSVEYQLNSCQVFLRIVPYRKYELDSILMKSTSTRLNNAFLYNILKSDLKSPNHLSLNRLKSRIRTIPFVEMIGQPEISIKDTSASIVIYLKERSLNQFFAMVGILSDGYNSSDIKFTGEAQLTVYNFLQRGILFDMNWQKNIVGSQFLNLKTAVPYLFNTPFGISAHFSLENIDSQYLRRSIDLSGDYYLEWNQILSVNYRSQSSSISNFDKTAVINGVLPGYLDYSTTQFGVGYRLNTLDKPLFSRKGLVLDLNTLVGSKIIYPNSKISELSDNSGRSLSRLYDSIKLEQLVISGKIALQSYLSLSNQIVLKNSLDARFIFSDDIRQNDMNFFGGYKKPRGFDDNQFLSPIFSSFTTEFQYFFSEYFYSHIFADVSTYQSTITQSSFRAPIGVGTGVSIKSKGSILHLSLATGLTETSAVSFSNTKVHLGYVAVF
jgi:hypothetical protein